ncbi:MAG: class I SAM-dependent methyltransferase [Bradyrhizobiaceae bacterium]|nr:MAG: class I SAM-dependent methyltransferase [Bradyrhizobiaceae bacterium]
MIDTSRNVRFQPSLVTRSSNLEKLQERDFERPYKLKTVVEIARMSGPLFYEEWFTDKTFTSDWTSHNFPVWISALVGFRDKSARILEIGSYEGRSAVFFLNYLPRSTIVCVDVFSVYEFAKAWPDIVAQLPRIERRFDRNVREFGSRVKKIKANSTDLLKQLRFRFRSFDIIYIDGDHRAKAAHDDCMLSWPLLSEGGVMIIDDYEFDAEELLVDRPKLGVDTFLMRIAGTFDEIHRGYQIIIQKRPLRLTQRIAEAAKRLNVFFLQNVLYKSNDAQPQVRE